MAKASYFIGVDIGGTFTDVVLAEAASHRLYTAKTLTTPDRPAEGVISAIHDALAAAQATPADVRRVVHATTLATNLILERKGSRVAYITTKGFGDLFVIGKERVVGADRYNVLLDKGPALVSRRLTLEIEERVNRAGEVIVPLNQPAAVEGLARLARQEPQAAAICLLHSYANPAHERAMADLVRKHMPGVYVALSSEIWPEFREFERASTTVMSAYVGPTISGYVEALDADLRKMGLKGSFEIMQSSGGVMSAAAVARKPVYSVESGPAAGVIAATHLGRLCNQPNIISFDMGGTTAKAGLIRHGRRLPDQDPGDRFGRSRCRRRQYRMGGRRRRAASRTAERRRGARTRLLRFRRRAADRDRCQFAARLSRSRLFPGRPDAYPSRAQPGRD
jgi:N-methylhydantoinase A